MVYAKGTNETDDRETAERQTTVRRNV